MPVHQRRRAKRGQQLLLVRSVPRRVGLRGLLSPVRLLETRAFARSAAGSESFANVFLAITIARAIKGGIKRKPETLVVDRLKPGESISVRTAKPPRRGLTAKERQRGFIR